MHRYLSFLLVFLLSCLQLQAQARQTEGAEQATQVTSPTNVEEENPEPTDENSGVSGGPYAIDILSDFEFWLSLAVLLFGVFVVILEYRLLLRTKAGPNSIIRVLAVTLILVGSLFLITAGYSGSQISPVAGLFGTVAGYLLGKVQTRRENVDDSAKAVRGESKDV